MGNDFNKLSKATYSQYNYKDSIGKNIAEFFQDLVNVRFESASDYISPKDDNAVLEQTRLGGIEYKAIGVRKTHAINAGVNENFANEFRKLIFHPYTHEQYLGKQYKFDNSVWLTVNLDTRTNASSHSLIRKCNNVLKWVDDKNSNIINQWDCVFTKKFSGTGFEWGSQEVPQASADGIILVQQNELTKKIKINQRLLFDGYAFRVEEINNHLSKTYMSFNLTAVPIEATDDVVNNIANGQGLSTTSIVNEDKILPNTKKILQGQSQTYTVYNYVGGVKTNTKFDITTSQAPLTSYEVRIDSDNQFTITNTKKSPIPLIVRCINQDTNQDTSIEIVLGGAF